jgi:cytochrome P450
MALDPEIGDLSQGDVLIRDSRIAVVGADSRHMRQVLGWWMPVWPESDYDPYTDATLLKPWPGYRRLRDLGPAVWLTKNEMFALTRHASVHDALRDRSTFSSAYGVMMNDEMNQVLRGNTLCSDGAEHNALHRVVIKPLRPRALVSLTDRTDHSGG